DLLGAGVYYGAGPSEALACTDSQVVVVGGGNSAGQAVVRFSRYAQQVTLLARGPDLGASMSQYLIDQVSAIPNVNVLVRTQLAALEAGDRLRAVMMRSGDSTKPVPLPADALFICTGGVPRTPRTDDAAGIGLVTNTAGYLMTGSDAASDPAAAGHCPGSRCRWRPICLECLLRATCAAGRSNAAPRPPARDRWPWRSSTGGWRRWAVTDQHAAANPGAVESAEFTELASGERIAKPQRRSTATASGRCWPPRAPTPGAWSAPCSQPAPRCTTTPPAPLKPSASPPTSNGPAATSRSGCGSTGWTGKCSSTRCAPWPPRPAMSSAACTRSPKADRCSSRPPAAAS